MTRSSARRQVGSMLSAIVLAEGAEEKLPGALAVLTSAAVEGLVRDVHIVGGGPETLLEALREATGAELAANFDEAVSRAASDLLLVLEAGFRPRSAWIEDLAGRVRAGERGVVIAGEGGGVLKRAPYAVVIEKRKALGLAQPSLKELRRRVQRRGRG